MECPVCLASNPATALCCEKCSTPLPLSGATLNETIGAATSGWSIASTPSFSQRVTAQGSFPPGTVLSGRYEIIQLLGQGGMGSVYKARDIELDRIVALKLIRPDLASHPEILRRFKQEL